MNIEQSLIQLLDIIEQLLAPNGCPWDRKQTPESLCNYVVEEIFEMVEAIRNGNTSGVCEELGDVLFLIVFIVVLYKNQGSFDLSNVLENSATKMVRRHPHVFADASFKTQKELLTNWERIKCEERLDKHNDSQTELFNSLLKGLPSLLQTYRIQTRAEHLGFTWERYANMNAKLYSKWREMEQALALDDCTSQEEFGEYLFCLVECGRRKGFNANEALDVANHKFIGRFARMEGLIRDQGLHLTDKN